MTPNIIEKPDGHAALDTTRESVSQIAASIASRLARSRGAGDGTPVDETPRGSVSLVNEVVRASNNDRLGENSAQVVVTQMLREHMKLTPDEYRARADACLNWAREALNDEARLACITLAQTWLEAAVRDGCDVMDGLPLAPTL
jgi:hypothetical protein